jgi:hypothetical protein
MNILDLITNGNRYETEWVLPNYSLTIKEILFGNMTRRLNNIALNIMKNNVLYDDRFIRQFIRRIIYVEPTPLFRVITNINNIPHVPHLFPRLHVVHFGTKFYENVFCYKTKEEAIKRNIECPIELEPIKKGNSYMKCDSCKYNFSFKSMKKHLNNNNNCPMCRKEWVNNVEYINLEEFEIDLFLMMLVVSVIINIMLTIINCSLFVWDIIY